MPYTATLAGHLTDGRDFLAGRYSRAHALHFDGGATVPASASPESVGLWADPTAIDPEEMLVASVSSCHVLWFLHMARLDGFTARAYRDTAEATMSDVAPNRRAITRVVLHPQSTGSAPLPTRPDSIASTTTPTSVA